MREDRYHPGYFKDKKITLMGLGLLGRGIGDAKFFAEEGAELIVTDLRTEEELASSLQALKDFPTIRFHLGGHRLEDFRDRDFILKAAGVPQDSPFLAEAKEHNVPIKMSTSLFASLTPATIVGITGTRGKSTVTQLVYEVLRNAVDGTDTKVFLGGNVRGVATLPFLRQTKEGDFAVLELDSWQLQGFGDEKISPSVGIFTTFMVDHMNYYKGDMDSYLDDKANIFKFQKQGDCLIIGKQAEKSLRARYSLPAHVVADPEKIPKDWMISVPGEHNRGNVALAIETARALKIPEPVVRRTVERFKGVPGRLQLIKTWKGIAVYNDTNATTPDATLAALNAISVKKNIILIMGGADKGLAMDSLISSLKKLTKAVMLLPGSGSSRIKDELDSSGAKVTPVLSLEHALSGAVKIAKKGDCIMLSPAFASFGLFANEYDRGDQFDALVNRLN